MAAAVRSLLGFWAGGASAPPTQAGFRGLLAFWMGGAVPGPFVQPPPVLTDIQVGPPGRPTRIRFSTQAQLEDEELLLIISAALHVIDPPL